MTVRRTEVSYANGGLVKYETPGSVRVDIASKNCAITNPTSIQAISIRGGTSMRGTYLRKLYKNYFIGQFPEDFLYQGHLIYHKKFEYILRGFCFEDSAFETNAFNMYVFVQPLYIPSTYLWFSFGKRLGELSYRGSDRWWTITPENEADVMSEVIELMKGPGLRFLEKIQSPGDLIVVYGAKQNYNVIEALAYARLINQEYKTSRKSLLRLITTLKAEIERNPQIKWLSEILSKSSLMYDLVS